MFSLLFIVKFVHIITSMVYFGLPFAFGRWFSNISSGTGDLNSGVAVMKRFTFLHLNLCAVILGGTGLYLSITMGYWTMSTWPHMALLLLILSVFNLNFNLGLALKKVMGASDDGSLAEALKRHTRMRILVFSAVHHTLITAATALMIFRV